MFDIHFVKNVHGDNVNVGSAQALRFVSEAACPSEKLWGPKA